MSKPLVSVIACCYNHEAFLAKTLDSIVAQTYPNIELIIMEDASKDNSLELVKEWIEKQTFPCTFLPNPVNKGVCYTLNRGLKSATGKYWQAISCDDILLPDKIERQVKIMEEVSEEVTMIYADALMINREGKEIAPSLHDFFGYQWQTPENMLHYLIKRNSIIAPSTLMRRAHIMKLGMFDEDLCYEDWDMWLRLARAGYQFLKMEEVVLKYRYFDDSMSQSKKYKGIMAKDSVVLLEKHKGITAETNQLIVEAQRPFITAMIAHNDASTAVLWKKLRAEKSAYSFFLWLCSLVGIDQDKAHALKDKLKRK